MLQEMVFLVLLAIPVLVGLVAFRLFPTITWKEFLAQLAVQAAVAGISVAAIFNMNTSDQEILHGVVRDKKQVWVHCRHSYQCNCVNVCSGTKTRTCTRVCSTCYEHPNDWDWTVYSNINLEIDIDTIDRRGAQEPPRWTLAKIGEPFSAEHSYTNYIKASPGSLLRHQGLVEKYVNRLPAFPERVYDYYRRSSLVLVNGARVPGAGAWNDALASANSRLGPRKQVDLVVVLAKNLPQEYFYALEQHWIGGKGNSAVLVINVNDGFAPTWAAAMSWTDNKRFAVELRDSIMGLPQITHDAVVPVFEQTVQKHYKRKSMSDFEYLKSSIVPTTTQWVVSLLIGLLLCVGMTWFFHKHEVFE